jgi:hypothetical protein
MDGWMERGWEAEKTGEDNRSSECASQAHREVRYESAVEIRHVSALEGAGVPVAPSQVKRRG